MSEQLRTGGMVVTTNGIIFYCLLPSQVQVADIGLMGAPAKKANAEGVLKAVPGFVRTK